MTLGGTCTLDIEARQPQRATHNKCTSRQPAPSSPRNQRPKVNENCRGHAERNDVGQGVELNTELTGGSGQTRRVAIQSVENVGQDDEKRRRHIVPVESRNDGKKAADQIARRNKTGNQIDSLS